MERIWDFSWETTDGSPIFKKYSHIYFPIYFPYHTSYRLLLERLEYGLLGRYQAVGNDPKIVDKVNTADAEYGLF